MVLHKWQRRDKLRSKDRRVKLRNSNSNTLIKIPYRNIRNNDRKRS